MSEALPGVTRGDMASRRHGAVEVRTRALAFSPTGRAFAVAGTEGLLVYALDDSLVFDPFELGARVGVMGAREGNGGASGWVSEGTGNEDTLSHRPPRSGCDKPAADEETRHYGSTI